MYDVNIVESINVANNVQILISTLFLPLRIELVDKEASDFSKKWKIDYLNDTFNDVLF